MRAHPQGARIKTSHGDHVGLWHSGIRTRCNQARRHPMLSSAIWRRILCALVAWTELRHNLNHRILASCPQASYCTPCRRCVHNVMFVRTLMQVGNNHRSPPLVNAMAASQITATLQTYFAICIPRHAAKTNGDGTPSPRCRGVTAGHPGL